VRADELLTAFLELESAIRCTQRIGLTNRRDFLKYRRNGSQFSLRRSGVSHSKCFYDYQICCPHICSRTWYLLCCASSITRPKRIGPRDTPAGRESCIALSLWPASRFAQSTPHSQESESGEEIASDSKASRADNRKSHESAGTGRWSWLGMG